MNRLNKVISILLAALMVLSMSISVFAIEEGDSIHVTATKENSETGSPYSGSALLFTYKDYVGTCVELGKSWGSANGTTQRPSADLKKAAYYFGVVLGWDEGLGKDPDADGWATKVRNAHKLELVLQSLNGTTSGHGAYDTIATETLAAFPEWESVAVPASFDCWYVNTNSDSMQDCLIWNHPTGKLKLKKQSALPLITDAN